MTRIAPSRARIFSYVSFGVLLAGVFIFTTAVSPAHAATIYLSGNVTTTPWTAGNVYVIQFSATIPSGTNVTASSGAIVKFGTDAYLQVNSGGSLNVQGGTTSSTLVYFTALDDNSVGGNTNGNSTTTPAKGDGGYLYLTGGTSTISNAVVRYGGSSAGHGSVYETSGALTVSNTTVASGTNAGINIAGGSANISSSTMSNNTLYGFYQTSGSLTVSSDTFANNSTDDGYINWSTGMSFSNSNNVDMSVGTSGYRGFFMAGTIGANTTWTEDLPYIISSGNVVIASGTTVTANPGAIVKFVTGGSDIQVNANATLNVQGTSTNPVYFTALTDDSVGGDTNGDGISTTATPGSSGCIVTFAGASTTIANALIKYGGANNSCYAGGAYFYGAVVQTGGTLAMSNDIVASSTSYGVQLTSGGTAIITSSTFSNNHYGIYESGSNGSLTLTSSTFSSNTSTDYDASISGDSGFSFESLGNTTIASGTAGTHAFALSNTFATSTTLNPGVPYFISYSAAVGSGTTMTVNPGVVIKLASGASLAVNANGALDVAGTSASPTYFTSIMDDAIGGDTNGDGTSTSGTRGSGGCIGVLSGASATISNAVVRYGASSCYLDGNYYYGNIVQTGGTLNLSYATVASSSEFGLELTAGTSTVTYSQFLNNAYDGVYMVGGGINASESVFANNGSYGFYHSSVPTSTAIAEYNYWNSASGPGGSGPGTGDSVSPYVDYTNWLTASPYAPSLSGLGQFKSDGTPIGEGSTMAENYITFKATLSSPTSATAQLQVEVQPAGVGFGDTPNATSSFVNPSSTASATFYGLKNQSYHWQARAVDSNGLASNWQSFGTSTLGIDFYVSSLDNAASEYFNGSSSLTYSAASDTFSANASFTVELWYRIPTSTASAYSPLIDTQSSTGNGYLIARDGTNGIFFDLGCATGLVSFSAASSSANYLGNVNYDSNGIWHYVAITKNTATSSSAFHAYFDGASYPLESIIESPLSGNCFTSSSTDSLQIGAGLPQIGTSTLYLIGDVDEVRIWKTEKSAADVSSTWNTEMTSTDPNLVGLWHFNNTSTDIATGHTPTVAETPVATSSTPFGHFLMSFYPNPSPAITSTKMMIVYNYNGVDVPSELVTAMQTWNNLGVVTLATTTDYSATTVEATTSYRFLDDRIGWWDQYATPTTITFNTYQTGCACTSSSTKLNVSLHELGHALGLDHSYYGNVMNYYPQTPPLTTLQSQDLSDFHFLWGN